MTVMDSARELKHRLFLVRKGLTSERRFSRRLRSRGVLLAASASVSEGVRIEPGVIVGAHSWVNAGAFIEDGTRIGERVAIGPSVTICTVTHQIGPESARAGQPVNKPVVIGDGCWLGASVTVLPGVTIGRGCVIAAGAVVREDCDPNGLYAGVPARRVRDLD